jgi:hypothetical protein
MTLVVRGAIVAGSEASQRYRFDAWCIIKVQMPDSEALSPDPDPLGPVEQELVRLLRLLDLSELQPGVRERCWEDFRQLAGLPEPAPEPERNLPAPLPAEAPQQPSTAPDSAKDGQRRRRDPSARPSARGGFRPRPA